MAGPQFITVDQMNLVTATSSNGRTMPFSQCGENYLLSKARSGDTSNELERVKQIPVIRRKTNSLLCRHYCTENFFEFPLQSIHCTTIIIKRTVYVMLLHNIKQHNVNVTLRNVTKRCCTQHKSSKT